MSSPIGDDHWVPGASRAFLELAPDAVVITDRHGTIVLVNAQTETLFGHPRADLIGRSIEVLVPERFRDAHLSHRFSFVSEPRARAMGTALGLFGRRADGIEFPVDISISVLDAGPELLLAAAIREVTERVHADEVLRASEAKFRSFLESAPDAVVIIDADGLITLVNAQTESLFGYRRAELIGQPVETLLPERFRAAHTGHRSGYAENPRPRSMGAGLELFGRRRDGTEFAIDISLSSLDTEEGLLLAAAIRDVTDRKRLEAARDEFIHHAAHELRTPLATLAALGETLALHMPEMSEENIAEALSALKRQGERASALVANLLDLSNLDGGRTDVQLGSLDLRSVVASALDGAPPPDRIVVVDETPDLHVTADRVQLERVFTNLLSNAYRYGGSHVIIAARRSNDDDVVIRVSDNGDGVPVNLVPTVFDPFTRGRDAGAVGGSGIGLALCRRILEAFGGEIWYEPVEPHGACFCARLRSAP
jgi:protein-histidine pros-kinase